MAILRFPNPVSDVDKFVYTFRTIYSKLKGNHDFTHDDVVKVLIQSGLVSSSGAIGHTALTRSTRDDRSRDPLYNQIKMYSELYRMLGWLKPGTQRIKSDFTEIANYIGEQPLDDSLRKLIEYCVISIVSPNPLVNSLSGNIIRPFLLILNLLDKCDGKILRDEIIIAVLSNSNDQEYNADKCSAFLHSIRGNYQLLLDNLSTVVGSIQENTLKNYTRFPLGVLKSTEWATRQTDRSLYNKYLTYYKITEKGKTTISSFSRLKDIRHEMIESYSLRERGAFTLLSYYMMLGNCGYNIEPEKLLIDKCLFEAKNIIADLSVTEPAKILYSPFQQSTQEEIKAANDIESE